MDLCAALTIFRSRYSKRLAGRGRRVSTERTAVSCSSKFADYKWKTINHIVLAGQYRKSRNHFLTQQLRCLEKSTSCPVKTASAAKIRKKQRSTWTGKPWFMSASQRWPRYGSTRRVHRGNTPFKKRHYHLAGRNNTYPWSMWIWVYPSQAVPRGQALPNSWQTYPWAKSVQCSEWRSHALPGRQPILWSSLSFVGCSGPFDWWGRYLRYVRF